MTRVTPSGWAVPAELDPSLALAPITRSGAPARLTIPAGIGGSGRENIG